MTTTFVNNFPFIYFKSDSDPTASESIVTDNTASYPGLFFWWNTSNNSFFINLHNEEDNLTWLNLNNIISAAAHITDGATNADNSATNNLSTDYGALTSLLQLANALNTTNQAINDNADKYNDLADKYNDLASKVNTLFDHLEEQGLQENS